MYVSFFTYVEDFGFNNNAHSNKKELFHIQAEYHIIQGTLQYRAEYHIIQGTLQYTSRIYTRRSLMHMTFTALVEMNSRCFPSVHRGGDLISKVTLFVLLHVDDLNDTTLLWKLIYY
jgi:hypothetical protein